MASILIRSSRNATRWIRTVHQAPAHGLFEYTSAGARGIISNFLPQPTRLASSTSIYRCTERREIASLFYFAGSGWTRSFSAGGSKDDAPRGNEEYLEFGSHTTATAKRFAVGTTALDDVSSEGHIDGETKDKAKEILLEVGEKLVNIQSMGEETKVRQLHEKLVSTEGISDVMLDMYNKKEEHAEYSQSAAGGTS